jgi:multidrug resistance efflux pump
MSSGIVETSPSGSERQPQQNQPVARTRLVDRLLAATSSLPNFIHDLILTQAHVVAGTEAAAFLIEPAAEGQSGHQLKAVAHIRPDDSDAETRAQALDAFRDIMRQCIEQGKDGAIQIEGTNDGSESQFCLITLLRNEGQVFAASAVITRARDTERAQKLLTPMQLVAGYFSLFTLRRRDEQSRSVAQSHQHVLQLLTSVATAEGFDAAAMNLCNELAARTGAARVSLGWLKGNHVKLKALSHTEEFDKKQELSVQLVKVMEECVDNDEIVQFEPDGASSNTVTREAQILSRTQGGETVLSLPLRRNGEIVSVVTLEFASNKRIGPQAATGLAVAVELLSSNLYDRYQNDRYLITKAGVSLQDIAKKTWGPKYWLAKTVVALSILAVALLFLIRPMYHVSSGFEFTPIQHVAISAPFEGELREVLVKPNDQVQAGQVLVRFDSSTLEDQLNQALSDSATEYAKITQFRSDDSKAAERKVAEAAKAAADAKVAYFQKKIAQAEVRSPIAGRVLNSDLEHKRGAMFRLGDPLMEVGQPDSLKAELHVADRDIQDVRVGARGELAVSSSPTEKVPFIIERIVPATEPKEGENVFKVYAKLDHINEDWLPGMRGEARIDFEKRSLAWIWTHRFIDFVRLKLWI